MDCCICFNDVKELDLIKAGCCSINICKSCVKSITDTDNKCPQCRKIYFWNETDNYLKSVISDLKCIIKTINHQYNETTIKNHWLNSKNELLHSQNNDLIKWHINNNKKINKLEEEIMILKNQKRNEEYLNRLIQIYHLNII